MNAAERCLLRADSRPICIWTIGELAGLSYSLVRKKKIVCKFFCVQMPNTDKFSKYVFQAGKAFGLPRTGKKLKITFPFYGKGTGIRKRYVKGREI